MGTTEEWIYPVVMARSNAEIALLKKTFQEKCGDDLAKILSGELSGDLKKMQRCCRYELAVETSILYIMKFTMLLLPILRILIESSYVYNAVTEPIMSLFMRGY